MNLLIFQVENTGRCSAHSPGQTHIETSKLTEENHQLGFIKGISLQDIFPKTFIFSGQGGSWVFACYVQPTNCYFSIAIHLLLSNVWKIWGTLVLTPYPSPGKYSLWTITIFFKRLLKAHVKEAWFPFIQEHFALKDQNTQCSTHRQCPGMALFGDTPSLCQNVATDHHKAPFPSHLEGNIEIHSGLAASPIGQGPEHLLKTLHR